MTDLLAASLRSNSRRSGGEFVDVSAGLFPAVGALTSLPTSVNRSKFPFDTVLATIVVIVGFALLIAQYGSAF